MAHEPRRRAHGDFVASKLERHASFSTESLSFWHYRESEREVDVIAERPSGEIVGLEVKAGATVRTLPFGEKLWAVPLQCLWRV